jgi:predicted O-methyltransferase YrrM
VNNVPSFDEVMLVTRKVSGSAALEEPEARALYDCCVQVPKDGIVVEVGCQLGRSSSLIAQVGYAIGYHTVHIDPYKEQPEYLRGWADMMLRLGKDSEEHAFTFLCMRTEQAKWLLQRLGPIDMAFIDGDHEQAGVEIDLKLVAEWIKRGGFLTAHDYGRESLPTVKAAIDGWIDFRWEQLAGAETLGVWRRR